MGGKSANNCVQATLVCAFLYVVAQVSSAPDCECYRDVKLHSTLLGWSNPDQALRVAAGILGKRASGGLTQALGSAARGAKPSRQCIEPGSLNPG
jgi:hypothetical protein